MQFTLYACSFWGHFGRKIVAAEMSTLVMSRLIRAFKLPAHFAITIIAVLVSINLTLGQE